MIFQIPPEWSEPQGLLIAWPKWASDWQENHTEISAFYRVFIEQLHAYGPIYCLGDPQDRSFDSIAKLESEIENLHLIPCSYDDTWLRDSSPIFWHENSQLIGGSMKFNAWGGKFAFHRDATVPKQIFQKSIFKMGQLRSANLIGEGGNLEWNSQGVALANMHCFLDPKRNPGMDLQAIELQLKNLYGFKQIHWLEQDAIAHDDTDGHIDTLVRFINDRQLVYLHGSGLGPLRNFVEALSDRYGYEAFPLPHIEGAKHPYSYANFIFLNKAILLPTFAIDTDRIAVELFQQLCPEHDILPLDCRVLFQQGGGPHCMSMQIPQEVSR